MYDTFSFGKNVKETKIKRSNGLQGGDDSTGERRVGGTVQHTGNNRNTPSNFHFFLCVSFFIFFFFYIPKR
jgi:hypothetical protein